MTSAYEIHFKTVLFNARLCKTWRSLGRELGCLPDEAERRANNIGVFSLPARRDRTYRHALELNGERK